MNFKWLFLLASAASLALLQPQQESKPNLLPDHFLARVGTFRADMEFYQEPGKIHLRTTGTQVNKLICGGLWLQEDLHANIGGTPFHGHGVNSYNAKTKVAHSNWVDSMSSFLMVQEGELDQKTGKLVAKASVEVENGKRKPGRLETLVIDKNKYEFRMYILGEKSDFLTMKITFTRK